MNITKKFTIGTKNKRFLKLNVRNEISSIVEYSSKLSSQSGFWRQKLRSQFKLNQFQRRKEARTYIKIHGGDNFSQF